MSQFWHAHWAEDSFKSTRLQNWEIPRWHAQWPNRHCTITKCVAHSNGHVYPFYKDSKMKWSDFQGTWELPLKIDRNTAEKISKSTEYTNTFFSINKKEHECMYNKTCKDPIDKNNKKNKKKQEKKLEDETLIKESKKEDSVNVKYINVNNCNNVKKCTL